MGPLIRYISDRHGLQVYCSICAGRRWAVGEDLVRIGVADSHTRDCDDCGRLHESEREVTVVVGDRVIRGVLQHGGGGLDVGVDF